MEQRFKLQMHYYEIHSTEQNLGNNNRILEIYEQNNNMQQNMTTIMGMEIEKNIT